MNRFLVILILFAPWICKADPSAEAALLIQRPSGVAAPSVAVDLTITYESLLNNTLVTVAQLNSSTIGTILDTTSTTFVDNGGNYTTAKASKGNSSIIFPAWQTNLNVGGTVVTGSGSMCIVKDANTDNSEHLLWNFTTPNSQQVITYGMMYCSLTPPVNQTSGPVSMDLENVQPTGGTGVGTWIQQGWSPVYGWDFEAEDSGRTVHNSDFGNIPATTTNIIYVAEAIVDYTHKTQTNAWWDTTTSPWNQVGPEISYTNGVGTATSLLTFSQYPFDGATWSGSSLFAIDNAFAAWGANAVFPIGVTLGLYHPINITATVASFNSITLTWTSNPHSSSYNIDQSSDGGSTWSRISTSLVATTLTVNSLTPNQAYVFRVASNVGSQTSNTGLSNSATPHTVDWSGFWLADNPASGTYLDLSGHGNNGTAPGGLPAQVTGVNGVGHASQLAASGGCFLDMGNPSILQITSEMTLNIWVNFTDWPTSAPYQIVTKNAGGGHNGYAFVSSTSGGGGYLGFVNPSTGGFPNLAQQPTQTFVAGTWYMLTMTWDGANKTVAIYINGTFAASGVGTDSAIVDSGNELLVGVNEANYGFGGAFTYCNASVEGFGIINRLMSTAEIAAQNNSGNVVVP